MNIIMAFVIDVYTSIEDSVTKEKEEKEALIRFGEQALKHQEKLDAEELSKQSSQYSIGKVGANLGAGIA
jgi:hypothetical protein